jgi:arginase
MDPLSVIDAPLDCSGKGRGEELAPAALRAAGIVERLDAHDAGETNARIRDARRDPDTGVIGAADVRRASAHGPRPGRAARSQRPAARPSRRGRAGPSPDELGRDVALEYARVDPAIHALTAPAVRERGAARTAADAAARLADRPAWLHLDLDVLDEDGLPAVSYPQPLGLDELVALARPLAAAPNLIGVSVADFNPDRDPDGMHAERVVEALHSTFRR